MAARRKLTDVDKVRKVVDAFIKNPYPTASGLVIALGIKHLATLHKYMDEESEIGDLLCRAYLHIVYSHEIRMFDSKATPSIYYLKTLRKLGFNFRDTDPDAFKEPPKQENITFNIVKRD